MLLISNFLQNYMHLPKEAIIRINMAWIQTFAELSLIIDDNKHKEIFLDYPQGRMKPPKPTLQFKHALMAMALHKNIKYFAISNVENKKDLKVIKDAIPAHIELVPKIETVKGIDNIEAICSLGIKKIMLDKEDLYLSVRKNNHKFFNYVEKIRRACKKLDVQLLELRGVIFHE